MIVWISAFHLKGNAGGVERYASMVEYEPEAATLLMAHRNATVILSERNADYHQTVLNRLTAAHPPHPITELHILLPLKDAFVSELVASLPRQRTLRHVLIVVAKGRHDQVTSLMNCFASLSAMDSFRIETVGRALRALPAVDSSFAACYCAMPVPSILGARWERSAQASACQVSELRLCFNPSHTGADIKWQELLVDNNHLRALTVDYVLRPMMAALKRNTSLFKLFILDDDVPVGATDACAALQSSLTRSLVSLHRAELGV